MTRLMPGWRREAIIRRYLEGATYREIRAEFGCARSLIRDLVLALEPGNGRTGQQPEDIYEPTPKEIANRAAAVRARWSETTRKRRAEGTGPTPWVPQEFETLAELTGLEEDEDG